MTLSEFCTFGRDWVQVKNISVLLSAVKDSPDRKGAFMLIYSLNFPLNINLHNKSDLEPMLVCEKKSCFLSLCH